jgi:hypothetical protein
MGIFVIFRVQDPIRMRAAILSHFPDDHFDLGGNEWLVSSKETAKSLSDMLGVTKDPSETGSAMVFAMASYFGRAPTDVWDWIKSKAEATSG